MANTLLLLQPTHQSRAAVLEAINAVKATGGRLLVVGTLDPELTERVSETLTDAGFVGEKVSDRVCDTLLCDYRDRANAMVEEIVTQAKDEGVDAEGLVELGEPADVCARLARSHQVELAILVAERRSWLGKFLSRATVQIPELPGCEVRVIDED